MKQSYSESQAELESHKIHSSKNKEEEAWHWETEVKNRILTGPIYHKSTKPLCFHSINRMKIYRKYGTVY